MFGTSDIRDGKAVVTADVSHFTSEQLEVLAAYQAMQQAMVSADHDVMRDIVEEGTTFTHMSGYTQTKEEFIAEVELTEEEFAQLEAALDKITVYGHRGFNR